MLNPHLWLHLCLLGWSQHLHVDKSAPPRSWLVPSPHGPVSLRHLRGSSGTWMLQWVVPKTRVPCAAAPALSASHLELIAEGSGAGPLLPATFPGKPGDNSAQGQSLIPGWGSPGAQLQPLWPLSSQCPAVPASADPPVAGLQQEKPSVPCRRAPPGPEECLLPVKFQWVSVLSAESRCPTPDCPHRSIWD